MSSRTKDTQATTGRPFNGLGRTVAAAAWLPKAALPSDEAIVALVRILARQAAREHITAASNITKENVDDADG
jgi:hypothetical protein